MHFNNWLGFESKVFVPLALLSHSSCLGGEPKVQIAIDHLVKTKTT